MRELEVAWAAGIIEGEGTVSLALRKRKGKKRAYPFSEISVAQANWNYEMLFRLQALWGGGVGKEQHRPPRMPYRKWVVVGRKAGRVAKELAACQQFRGPKRLTAEAIAAFYELKDMGLIPRHSPPGPKKKNRLEVVEASLGQGLD